MDVIESLKSDHRKVSDLFDELEAIEDSLERRDSFVEIEATLRAHIELEEASLYPFLLERAPLRESIESAYDDHQEIKDLLRETLEASDDEEFEERLDELFDATEAHFGDEEDDTFPKMRETLSASEMTELMERVESMRSRAERAA